MSHHDMTASQRLLAHTLAVKPCAPSQRRPSQLLMSQVAKLRLRGARSDGGLAQEDWVASMDGGQLKWYLVWQIESAGYEISKGRKHCQHIADQWKSWCQAVSQVIEITPTVMGSSRLSLKKRHAADDALIAESEQEHWCNSQALLCLWLHWTGSHRKKEAKKKACGTLRLFLSSVLSATDCEMIMKVPDPDHDAACPASVPEQGCHHLTGCRVALSREHPQDDVATLLEALYLHRSCPLVKKKLLASVVEVAAAVDASYERWSEVGWELSADAFLDSACKRRRLSEHVTSHVINNAVAGGRFSSASTATRAMDHVTKKQGQQIVQREVSALRQSLLRRVTDQQCVALAADASRIGKPKQDLLLGALSFPDNYVHGCAVPQVPGKSKQPSP